MMMMMTGEQFEMAERTIVIERELDAPPEQLIAMAHAGWGSQLDKLEVLLAG